MGMLVDINKKGRFVYMKSTRQAEAYDIYFVADGDFELKFFCTVPVGALVGVLCKTFTQIHNTGVEEYEKKKIREKIHNQVIPKAV